MTKRPSQSAQARKATRAKQIEFVEAWKATRRAAGLNGFSRAELNAALLEAGLPETRNMREADNIVVRKRQLFSSRARGW